MGEKKKNHKATNYHWKSKGYWVLWNELRSTRSKMEAKSGELMCCPIPEAQQTWTLASQLCSTTWHCNTAERIGQARHHTTCAESMPFSALLLWDILPRANTWLSVPSPKTPALLTPSVPTTQDGESEDSVSSQKPTSWIHKYLLWSAKVAMTTGETCSPPLV